MLLAVLILIGLVTLWPLPDQAALSASTPFLCFPCGPTGGADFILNVALFLPLGLALGARGRGIGRATLIAAGVTGLIELLQVAVVTGRDASAADLVANTLGGALGALAAHHWRELLFVRRPRLAATGWAAMAAICIGLTAWSLSPSLPDGPWYGQWAASGPEPEWFDGRVLDAELGHEPLPHWRLSDSERRRAGLLRDTLRLAATIVTAPPPTSKLRIVALGHPGGRIVTLSQAGRALEFSLRTRAMELALHSPVFRVPDALPAAAGDTTGVEGRYWHGWVAVQDRRFEVGGVDGWTLLLAVPMGGPAAVGLCALWLTALFAPIGWFGGQARSPSWAVAPGIAVLMASLLVAGVTLTPLPAPWQVAVAALAIMAGRIGYAWAEAAGNERAR